MSGERVNIAYTVELDEVLNEIKGMIDYISFKIGVLEKNFSAVKPDLAKKIDEKEFYNVNDFLNNTRNSIVNIDYRIGDCTRLIHGYNTYLLGQQKQEPNEPQPNQEAQTYHDEGQSGEIDEIQERIASLKKAVETGEPDNTNV